GARIAVGCWKFAPARVLIVSAAYLFARLNPSKNTRSFAGPTGTVFSMRTSTTLMLSWRYALSGVANTSVADKLPSVMLPMLPAAALKAHRQLAGADTDTRRAKFSPSW